MSRSLPLLQKKLQELETVFPDAYRQDTTVSGPDPDVDKRFLFLEKLLAAELASHPEASNQLREIEQRLARLKLAFRGLSQWRNDDLISREDSLSVCSDCTQALRFDEDDDDEDVVPIPEDANYCLEKHCWDCSTVEKESEVEEAAALRRGRGGIGKVCGAFGCGVIIGGICVLELLSSSIQFIQYDAFTLPPT